MGLRSLYGMIGLLLLGACIASLPTSVGATSIASLPVSVADIPQAAALRTAPRIALVIGNDRYQNWGQLRSAGSDARAVAQNLQARGFELVGGRSQIDVSSGQLRRLLDATEAAVRAKPGAIVAVFFSGHGFADQGRNYLAPTDAPGVAQAVPASLAVSEIAQRLRAAGSALTMMFLDACREYELGRGGGLEEEAVPDNTFIGYATLFGGVAREPRDAGMMGRSYYTAALLRAIDAGSDNLDDMHLKIAEDVLIATQGQQAPVYRHGLRMPTAPIRLAINDPQTAYALIRNRGGGAPLATECAAMSDLRLVLSLSGQESAFGGAMKVGPRNEPVDISRLTSVCRAAYTAGFHNPAVLRGLAIAELLPRSRGEQVSPTVVANAYALLSQAAEAGDALTNLALAFTASEAAPDTPQGQFPADAVRDRLLNAAEQNQAPLTGLIGLLLWRPELSDIRSKIGLPGDSGRGLRLFQRAVLSGDPLLQPLAMSMRLNKDPAVANLDLRGALHRALGTSSGVGFEIEGLNAHQSLYLFALLDALAGTYKESDKEEGKDTGELVRLTLEAEPFLAQLGSSFARTTGRPNPADGFLVTAACALASGRDLDGRPVPDLTPDRQAALRLLRKVSGNPPLDIRRYASQLAAGSTCR